MQIKINDFSPIPHRVRLRIVNKYIEDNESQTTDNSGWLGTLNTTYKIKETGKHPVIINDNRNYYLKCRKTPTQYVFDIWLAP